MSTATIINLSLGLLFALLAYWFGCLIGAARQRDKWADHMDKANRYAYAVDDLDKWCGHTSPHARLIARHLQAHGEGESMNGGTPMGDEACTIAGLREQLRRLDAKAPTGTSQENHHG